MSAPIKHTCPDIDKIVKWIASAMQIAKDGRKAFPDADGLFHDIYYELDGSEDLLEQLRRANDTLRNWGHELEKEVNEKEEAIYTLEGEVEDLQQKITLCKERSIPTM